MPVNFNFNLTSERLTMRTSFGFVFFSLGGTEVLTELAACACTISPLFGSYERDEITGKLAKTEEKKRELLSL